MIFSLQSAVTLLTTYKYLIIFPISILEGPIIGVISGFLASLGILNLYVAFFILFMGDEIGDVLHYVLGRYGEKVIIRYGKYLGITQVRLAWAKDHYETHLWKTIIFGKITHAPNSLILTLAGVVRANFWEFLVVNTLTNIPKVLFFTLLGYYFGQSYVLIGKYIDKSIFIVWPALLVGILIYMLYVRKRKKEL